MGIKKLALNLVLGAALVIAPLSASALTPMTDNNMKDVTGQAGVSIGIDDIVIYQNIGTTKYIDTDGFGTASESYGAMKTTLVTNHIVANAVDAANPTADELAAANTAAVATLEAGGWGVEAAVVISEKEVLKQFNAILDDTKYGAGFVMKNGKSFGHYGVGIVRNGTTYNLNDGDAATIDDGTMTESIVNPFDGTTAGQANGTNNTTGISPLTIDIGMCKALTAGYTWNNLNTPYSGQTIAGVVIGLPTIEIVTSGDTYSVGVECEGSTNGDATLSPTGEAANFIKIEKSDATMAILGGRVEIAAH